jgi:mannose-1-phosphate guanylyltransferase
VAHRDQVIAQLPGLRPDRIIAEPSSRDSMAAIGLAAAMLEREDPDAVMGSFAADHLIADRSGFDRAVRLAAEVASDDWLVTVGITPTHPSSAFGYVRQGGALAGHAGAFHVEEFVEKPSLEVARTYLASGEFRWNAGMFVVRPRVLLDLLASGHPEFAAALRELAADPTRLAELWPTLPRIAIDHAVAEPAAAQGRVATVPGALDWDDLGDFHSLATALEAVDDAAVQVLGDADLVQSRAATGLVVPGAGRLIALVGIDDVVVVDTPDALLVTTRARAQEVKGLVDRLREAGRGDLT